MRFYTSFLVLVVLLAAPIRGHSAVTNFVTNGSFANNFTGWTVSTGSGAVNPGSGPQIITTDGVTKGPYGDVIVSDNALGDGSAEMTAARFPWVQVIANEHNLGFAGGHNRALRGADASHAWVAVWCGAAAGWVHLDPTNDLVAHEDHVAVAWGRDFSDVSPLRGVILGGDAHSYGVAVTLVPTT